MDRNSPRPPPPSRDNINEGSWFIRRESPAIVDPEQWSYSVGRAGYIEFLSLVVSRMVMKI